MTYINQTILNVLLAFLLISFLYVSTASAQNQHTNTFNFESSTLPYNWHTSGWSACSGERNEGNQNRTVAWQG